MHFDPLSVIILATQMVMVWVQEEPCFYGNIISPSFSHSATKFEQVFVVDGDRESLSNLRAIGRKYQLGYYWAPKW